MSMTAVTVPRTVPVTFERPTRGRYGTSTSRTRMPAADAARSISSGYPLRRSRRSSREQVLAPGDAHRPEVVQAQTGGPADRAGQRPVREPGVQRPGGAGDRPSPAEHEVRVALDHERDEPGEVAGIEGAVGVEDRDELRLGRDDPGVHRGAEPAPRLEDHRRAERPRDLRGAVRRAVVDDDRAVALRQRREHPGQRRRLVEAGQHHVDRHGRPRNGAVANARIPASNGTGGGTSSSARRRADDAVMCRTSPSR